MPPLAIGGAIAAGGIVGNIISSNNEANAAQNISQAQLNAQIQMRNQALALAGPSSWDMDALSRQNTLAMNSLVNQQAVLGQTMSQMSAANPAIQMAFQQQMSIMGGNVPDYLKPLQNQLNINQQANQSRINATLGRGGDTSSAGIAAQAAFSQQNSMTLMNTQQQALQNLGGVAGVASGVSNSAAATGMNAFSTASAMNQGQAGIASNLAQRQVNAALGTSVTPYAGASNVGSLMMNQSMGNMFGQMGGIGTSLALSQAFGGLPTAGGTGGGGLGGMGFNFDQSGSNLGAFGGTNPYASGGTGSIAVR